MKKDKGTDRKSGIRWPGLSDGESPVPWKLRVFISYFVEQIVRVITYR